jgi:hypothetical protein
VKGANYSYLTDDKIVCQGAAYLHGVIINASANAGSVTVWEGQDVGSGRQIATIKGSVNFTKVVNMPAPIYCQRGIFIDKVSNVDNFTVIWSRPEKEPVAS